MSQLRCLAKRNAPSVILLLRKISGCRISDAGRVRIFFMRGACLSGFRVVIRVLVRCVGIHLRMGGMGGGGGVRSSERIMIDWADGKE
jgi:hypothetical protein